MLREFDAQLEKGDTPGAWTCVVMNDAAALFGTRGLVKIRGAIDGEPFTGALMAQGDGTHRLPVKAALRKRIGKEAGDTVHVRIDERIGQLAASVAMAPRPASASFLDRRRQVAVLDALGEVQRLRPHRVDGASHVRVGRRLAGAEGLGGAVA